jgi:hypothetical protein
VADVAKRVGKGLDMLAIVSDGGVPLNKSVKLIAKVDRTRLPVVVEEVRDHGVEGIGGLTVIVHGEGEDGVIDRGGKLALDGVVGLCPHRIGGTRRNRRVKEGKESKLPDHGLEESAPTGEVRPIQFKVIGTCVLTLIVQKGLTTVGAMTLEMSVCWRRARRREPPRRKMCRWRTWWWRR